MIASVHHELYHIKVLDWFRVGLLLVVVSLVLLVVLFLCFLSDYESNIMHFAWPFVNACSNVVHRVRKKGATWFFAVTLPNPNRSSKFF